MPMSVFDLIDTVQATRLTLAAETLPDSWAAKDTTAFFVDTTNFPS